MAGNSFGQLFKITTFGESHGPAIGVVIDGVPPNIPLGKLVRGAAGCGACATAAGVSPIIVPVLATLAGGPGGAGLGALAGD